MTSAVPRAEVDVALCEAERLEALASYRVMDTPPDPELDILVRLASSVLGTPISLVSLVDARRQWFKARLGLEVAETDRAIAFCSVVVETGSTLVVTDARTDPRFAGNPLVTGEPFVRFYVGVPLRVASGHVLGTLCAIDSEPHEVTPAQFEQLHDLAHLAVARLEALRDQHRLGHSTAELDQHRRFFLGSMDLSCVATRDGRFLEVNPSWTQALGYTPKELCSGPFLSFVHPDDLASTTAVMEGLNHQTDAVRFRNRFRARCGRWVWLEWNALAPVAGEERIFASARDVTAMVEAGQALQRRNDLLALITESQTRIVDRAPDREWWTWVLQRLLDLTGSEYGFIGETGADEQGRFLRTKSITNIAWDDATRAFYAANAPAGMYFRNMGTLFGQAVLTEERVIANDVAHDPRAGGRPPGHPPLNAFAGLPLRDGTTMIGMVGLANRPGGFQADILDPLEPVLAYLGSVLRTLRMEGERQEFVARLESAKELQRRVLESSESGVVALHPDGALGLANARARELLPTLSRAWRDEAGPGLPVVLAALFPEPSHAALLQAIQRCPEGSRTPPHRVLFPSDRGPVGALDAGGAAGRSLAPDAWREERALEVTATPLREGQGEALGVLLTLTDLRERDALRESLRLNAALEERVNQLRRHQRDNEVLSECVEYLQGCATLAEGLELVGRSVERLFLGANTALYGSLTPGAPMALLRHAERFPAEAPAPDLPAVQCWALRSRRPYGTWPGSHHLSCLHADPAHQGGTFCVPLFSLDRNVAVFLVTFPTQAADQDALGQDARLSQFVAIGQSISGALSTIALRESLQRMALTDELTGLSNRRAFLQEGKRSLSRSRRAGSPYAVALLDIDHFKKINDTFGHDAGDQVLREVSLALRRGLRDGDLVARVGGEEFALFLPDLREDAAVPRAEALLASLRAACVLGGQPVTASLGVVHSADLAGELPLEALYRLADEALYEAKRGGRNRVVRSAGSGPGAPAGESSGRTRGGP